MRVQLISGGNVYSRNFLGNDLGLITTYGMIFVIYSDEKFEDNGISFQRNL